ncbi:MAG: zinc-binding dehydrogenase, partial [Pseudomonadales bacterium]|nr:zinc-binding dehydrogenase [Pseudomonadales bacterium]
KGVHVVAVDHTDKLAALTSLGVDEVIDYTTSDFTEREAAYDVVVDGVGKSDYRRTLDAIVPGGYYVMGNAPLGSMVRRFIPMMSRGRRPRIALAGYRLEDLERLAQLATEGRLKPVIDKTYPLSEVVAAHRYVESGKKIGNVVLTMGER